MDGAYSGGIASLTVQLLIPLMKQVLSQGPRVRIDAELVLVISTDRSVRPWRHDLELEWSAGSRWDVLGLASEKALAEWTVQLVQGLNRAHGEAIPRLDVPALRA
jgi:hypothetical protein